VEKLLGDELPPVPQGVEAVDCFLRVRRGGTNWEIDLLIQSATYPGMR
jgi:hypothetical protein